MDPRTGEFLEEAALRELPAEDRHRFSVEMRGKLEDIQRISDAIKESGSAKRKRKAVERREYWENRE